MKLNDYFITNRSHDYGDACCASGSFGIINDERFTDEGGAYALRTDRLEIISAVSHEKNGVAVRRDTLKNVSDKELVVNSFSGKIYLEGNDYEVYTQFNGWQNESAGGWQRLITQVKAANFGIRACEGATPMLGVYNRQTGKTHVFHLVDNCKWKLEVYKKGVGGKNVVTVLEYGFDDKGLQLTLAPNEVLELPELIFYECADRLDFDAYKLHELINERYPKRITPVMYNSWMYRFDSFTPEDIFAQIDAAAEYGIEAFVIDAGWFGEKGNWFDSVGDWTETPDAATEGRLTEIADRVRERGMKLGLWFEPERAESKSDARRQHPEYYFADRFTDFSDKAARGFVLNKVAAAIEKYGVEVVKFDFNKALDFDPTGRGFYDYFSGTKLFIAELKARFPQLYIVNCASGGLRMSLGSVDICDSFWLSDCHSPVKGVEIVKNTLKRLPPNRIDRWAVMLPLKGLPKYGTDGEATLTVSCGNCDWTDLEYSEYNYVFNFLLGGGCGFSCDLTAFSDEYSAAVKAFVALYKETRELMLTASASVLCETDELTVLEYFNTNKTTAFVQVFTHTLYQSELTVYPKLDAKLGYEINGKRVSGAELIKYGITLGGLKDNDCVLLTIKAV